MVFSETKHIHLSFYGSSQLQNTPGEAASPPAVQTVSCSNTTILTCHWKRLLKKKLLSILVDITNPLILNMSEPSSPNSRVSQN